MYSVTKGFVSKIKTLRVFDRINRQSHWHNMTSEDEKELSKNYARIAIPVSTTGLVLLIPVLILYGLS